MKVLVLDNVSEKAVAILKENGIEADVSPTLPLGVRRYDCAQPDQGHRRSNCRG
jgi:hypothetical protein